MFIPFQPRYPCKPSIHSHLSRLIIFLAAAAMESPKATPAVTQGFWGGWYSKHVWKSGMIPCWHHGNMGHDPSCTPSIRLEFQKVLCLISCLGHFILTYTFKATGSQVPANPISNWTLVLSQWIPQTKNPASTGEMTKGISWNSPAQPPKGVVGRKLPTRLLPTRQGYQVI